MPRLNCSVWVTYHFSPPPPRSGVAAARTRCASGGSRGAIPDGVLVSFRGVRRVRANAHRCVSDNRRVGRCPAHRLTSICEDCHLLAAVSIQMHRIYLVYSRGQGLDTVQCDCFVINGTREEFGGRVTCHVGCGSHRGLAVTLVSVVVRHRAGIHVAAPGM